MSKSKNWTALGANSQGYVIFIGSYATEALALRAAFRKSWAFDAHIYYFAA